MSESTRSAEKRTATLEAIRTHRLSAIMRANDRRLAEDAMRAAIAGGFRTIEFTLTTPGALDSIAAFSSQPELVVGAGTVLTVPDAEAAVAAGARFLVSPVCDPEVIAAAIRLNVVSIPGTFTPTEMQVAHRAGADLVKLFPAPASVPEFVRAVLGPLPFLKILPTAGVTADNLVEVLKAGAFAAGFVRALFDPVDMAARNFAAIERRARQLVSISHDVP